MRDECCRDGVNEDCLTVWPKLNIIAQGCYARVLLSYSQEIMEKNGEGQESLSLFLLVVWTWKVLMLERITSARGWPWVERLILSRNKTGSLMGFQGYSLGKVSTWVRLFCSPKWLTALLVLRSISGLNPSILRKHPH